MSRYKSYPFQLTAVVVLGLLSPVLFAAQSTASRVRPSSDPDAWPQPSRAYEATNLTATRPATPTLLNATALSSTQIELHWQDNSDNEFAFAILFRLCGCSAFEELGSVPGDSTRAIVSGLEPDTPYDFRVTARGYEGDSLVSSTVSATTLSETGICEVSDTVLCLRDGRFRVESGRIALQGYLPGFIVSENEGSAVMYFSSDTKWELMVNVQPRAGRYWLSASGLTEGREYDIYVTDLLTGEWWTFALPDSNPRVTNAALSQMAPQ